MTTAANAATIHTKDPLRGEVEHASGGRQTVLYTEKDQPTYMNVIPAFRCEELGPEFGVGVHPAFIVGGVEKSEIFVGTYQAVIRNGEALSLPGEDPTVNVDFDQARAACAAAGRGHHLATNWDWAAVALPCAKNGAGQLRGNTNNGRSHLNHEEKGVVTMDGRTLTGSGPDTWRHDGSPFGISDLVGNVLEWCDGLKLVGGKIIMPVDNNIFLPEDQWAEIGVTFNASCDSVVLSDKVMRRGWNSSVFSRLRVKKGFKVPVTLYQALLAPGSGCDLSGKIWMDNANGLETLPFRGGGWSSGGYAGLAALNLGCERSLRYAGVGFRPAFLG